MSATSAKPEVEVSGLLMIIYKTQIRTFQLELRDVRLQKDVDLRRGLLDGLLDGDRNAFEQLAQLKLLLRRE